MTARKMNLATTRVPARKTAAKKAPTKKAPAKKATTAKPAAKKKAPQRRSEPETLRLRSFSPSFTVNDLDASIAFYTNVLGFIVSDRWLEDGKLLGVMLKAGSCEVGLSQDDWAKGRDRKKGEGVRISCETVQDIDALATHIAVAGWRLTQPPTDQWGVRRLSVDDPDGYHLTIFRQL
jgi:catechol 2,3-dioxygenase-like lactoylglutathione lyase family enzyme